ncbi:MAG: DedA family protein [Methylobacter sp.]|uniref:DedA family protein n=1 Tax=Candidatus Methylobacter titanis TaxID=3053457 RepID=A0AA43Q2P5_9GAMM|nr:DedA family protein [Candidatus Methylobacter titanis]MDI1292119.1 DedA family protein [Candidatus Methylobacter titanis]
MFQKLYDKALQWSKHRHAAKYLCALSFAESSFFPIPPDVMLAPMALSQPDKAMRFALLTTVASVLGGMLGYLIGFFMFDSISPWLQTTHYWESYLIAKSWFEQWGFLAVFVAGFSPIPYKVFTIAAGALSMAFLPFVLASIIGRGGRFFLVAMLLAAGGKKLEVKLREYMDRLGWATVALVVIGAGIYKFLHQG